MYYVQAGLFLNWMGNPQDMVSEDIAQRSKIEPHFEKKTTFFSFGHKKGCEASVAERLSYPACKPGVPSLIPGFFSLSDETLNQGPVSVWP